MSLQRLTANELSRIRTGGLTEIFTPHARLDAALCFIWAWGPAQEDPAQTTMNLWFKALF